MQLIKQIPIHIFHGADLISSLSNDVAEFSELALQVTVKLRRLLELLLEELAILCLTGLAIVVTAVVHHHLEVLGPVRVHGLVPFGLEPALLVAGDGVVGLPQINLLDDLGVVEVVVLDGGRLGGDGPVGGPVLDDVAGEAAEFLASHAAPIVGVAALLDEIGGVAVCFLLRVPALRVIVFADAGLGVVVEGGFGIVSPLLLLEEFLVR